MTEVSRHLTQPVRGFVNRGLAVSLELGVLVVSRTSLTDVCEDHLSVYVVGDVPGGFVKDCTLGGHPPLQFAFRDPSGRMVFTSVATSPHLLLVTDGGSGAVHMIDVRNRQHVGYVAPPHSVPFPRGIAASGSFVAVSTWKDWDPVTCRHSVWIYKAVAGTTSWVKFQVVDGFCRPNAVRFCSGRHGVLKLVVFSSGGVLTKVVVGARSFRQVLYPSIGRTGFDVEECPLGWMVTRDAGVTLCDAKMKVLQKNVLPALKSWPTAKDWCRALVRVPGWGLIVMKKYHVQLFATRHDIAMFSMSKARVAWMAVVKRSIGAVNLSLPRKQQRRDE